SSPIIVQFGTSEPLWLASKFWPTGHREAPLVPHSSAALEKQAARSNAPARARHPPASRGLSETAEIPSYLSSLTAVSAQSTCSHDMWRPRQSPWHSAR